MKGKIITLFLCSALFILFSINTKVNAYPRFAAYYGDKCMDCHVNPSGGAMRNAGGIEFAKDKLNMDLFKKLAGKTEFSPKITKEISVGGDVRVLQADDQVPGATNFNRFLTMQGDIYVNAQVNKVLNIFVTSGIQIPGIDTKYEVFGMISKLPANLFFKVGRYKPNYGLNIVEHRAYQRKYLLNTPYDANTGFEIGISPAWLNLSVGLFNPMGIDFIVPTDDPHKMIVASTDFNFGFNDNKFNIDVGASFFNNPYNTRDSVGKSTITGNKKAWGGFTKIGIMKRVALLGEIDFEEVKTDQPLVRTLYGYGELNIILIQGLELRSQYELWNKNRDIDNTTQKRISAGVSAFPFFGFETEMMVRFPMEDTSVKNDEFQWTFHYYF